MARCKPSPQRPVASAVWTSDEYTVYQLNAKCQDFVTRYYARSLLTPDDGNMIDVNRRLFRLAFTNPCLMHASLAVALTYDRYLNTSSSSPRSVEECFHWSQSTALFNKKLREPVKTKDKDPIWGTAAALAVLTFSLPDAYRPEDSWPLKTGVDDLGWVSMISGKMSLWNMVDPLRNDSLFRVMAVTIAQMQAPLPEVGIEGIPEELAAVCRLNETSTSENPYFYAAHAVSRILCLPDNEVTTGQTQLFTHKIDGAFKELLLARDPIALSLLYIWYRKAGRSIWWVELRARVECPAICMYLQRFHADEVAVHALLQGDITTG
ncbi:c6 finger [Fusarium pseudoanthophilum]|uniref:C6 finger n=1 Tax=Fusarium pseudoanthophilum TaxID=48495 RepID=A0A8H5L394_9HYPO|nr:c6 finger [Fusarium pseudoanthophilum]